MKNISVRTHWKRNIDTVFIHVNLSEIATIVKHVVDCLSQCSEVIREAFIVDGGDEGFLDHDSYTN